MKLGTITRVGQCRLSRDPGVSHISHPNGAGSRRPPIFGTSYARAHGMRNDSQILYGDRTRCEKKIIGSTTNADARSVCASGCVVECRICNREVAGSNLGRGYFAPSTQATQPSIPPGSVNDCQLRLGRQRQVWLIPMANERVTVWVCTAGKTVKSLENTCHT